MVSEPSDEALHLCAAAEYRFAQLAVAALGHETRSDGSIWWTTAVLPPVLVQGGSLRRAVPMSSLEALSAMPGRALFRDAYSSLDLSGLGFVADTSETWMVRPAGRPAPRAVAGLTIARAVTADAVAAFERASYVNGGALAAYVAGAVHPGAATAATADLHLLIEYLGGLPVATAMAVLGSQATGIQAVTTHPAVRGRGIGAAMITACCAVSPDLPTALSSTPRAVPLYRSLGFVDLGPAPQWTRTREAQ